VSGLRIEWLDERGLARLAGSPPADLLSLVYFGVHPVSGATHMSRLPLELLGGVAGEAWWGSGDVRRNARGAVRLNMDGDHLFATFETCSAGTILETESRRGYDILLRTAEEEGYPHVLRAWNTVARINEYTAGQERYRLFCKGRAEAYAALWGPAFEARLPSCSAVGSPGGGLTVQMLASRHAGASVENPRQVSAYRYPHTYGPKSPSFARGLIAPPQSGGWLFVSGTASIVGHESRHPGDPVAQTEETMKNIERVLDEAGCPGAGGPLGARLHGLRVYVRRRSDRAAIDDTLERCLGRPSPVSWLLADVCREELLVEIEAIAPCR
jgi:enamine deaminase RidA (YjgF/YER057c/UK114 family)